MSTYTQRMIGAAKLDAAIYEEVEADASAMGQAIGVVALSSLAAGIGAAGLGARGLLGGVLASLLGWFVWAGITYLVGTKILPESQTDADFGQMLRTLGFSASPGILKVVGIVPLLGSLVVLVASIWMLVAMVIAVRQALDYRSTARAVGVCLLGFLVYLAVTLGFRMLAGGVGWLTG